MEIEFPIEFLVYGTPVSHQAKRADAREEWKARIVGATLDRLPEGHFASHVPVSVKIGFFPEGELLGDLDNLAKPILDALSNHIYIDDDQVHRLLLQKFEQSRVYTFSNPTPGIATALRTAVSVVYIRVSDDPHEDYE